MDRFGNQASGGNAVLPLEPIEWSGHPGMDSFESPESLIARANRMYTMGDLGFAARLLMNSKAISVPTGGCQ